MNIFMISIKSIKLNIMNLKGKGCGKRGFKTDFLKIVLLFHTFCLNSFSFFYNVINIRF